MLSVAGTAGLPPFPSFSQSSSSASLKRSISTPLFSLKSGEDVWKHNSSTPENVAKQMTLIDWGIFSKITRDELKPGQWTGDMKHVLSPNVVQFTKRFNNVTFWVIEEILSLKTPKQRADMISRFIKIINHLVELGNLHSSFAIKSALTSVSIHRLKDTWNHLSKKDRQNFEKTCALFSESENSQELRKFMDKRVSSNSGCLPNLATYLRDIIHVDYISSQSNNNHTTSANNHHEKLETIYCFIEKCQQSSYDEIKPIQAIFDYLVSLRYIEELQKFREDDYYKKSLKLEPDLESKNKKLSNLSSGSHYDIRSIKHSISYHNQSTLDLDRLNINGDDYSELLNKSFNGEYLKSKQEIFNKNGDDFKPGHRKTSSFETNLLLSSLNSNTRTNTPTNNSSTLNPNHHNHHVNKPIAKNLKFNLIDDSPIIDMSNYAVVGNSVYKSSDHKPKLEMSKKKNEDFYAAQNMLQNWNHRPPLINDYYVYSSSNTNNHPESSSSISYTDQDIIFSGTVNRKTILKDKKKHQFSFWKNYHLSLTSDSLLFCKTKPNQENPQRPYKKFPLSEWDVDRIKDDFSKHGFSQIFTLADRSCSTVYKIRTTNYDECQKWIGLIREAKHYNLKKFYI